MPAPAVDNQIKGRVRGALRFYRGPGLAITKRELARGFGATPRQIELAVNALRAEGEPISSNDHGYFLAERPEDLDPTVEHLDSRIRKIAATKRAVERARERLTRPPVDPNGQGRFA